MDANDRWVGGKAVVVQVGDQLDRGDDEITILYLLEKLRFEAKLDGGNLLSINGNHETMNAYGRFRYATAGGNEQFLRYRELFNFASRLKRRCGYKSPRPIATVDPENPKDSPAIAARRALLQPGGYITQQFLAPQNTVITVGKSVFCHGGLLPHTLSEGGGAEQINRKTRAWMRGEPGHEDIPGFLRGRESVVWARDFSMPPTRHGSPDEDVCGKLRESLEAMGVSRMLVGHTIQREGINCACSNQIYRLDVGMSKGCGDHPPSVLVIEDDEVVTVLREGIDAPLGCPAAEDFRAG